MQENTKVFLKNSYFQFRDDLQIFWSILFENGEEKAVIDIIKENVIIEESKEGDNTSVNTENQEGPNSDASEARTENNTSDEKLTETKAQILSRMAKMGQPLPKLAATTTDFSDSSDTEVKPRLPFQKPIAVPRKPKQNHQLVAVASSSTQLAPVLTTLTPYSPNLNVEAQCLNLLLTENRTQNTEIRMNMTKLETKIEKVLDKIDMMDSRGPKEDRKSKEDEILELEERLLELKKENRTLRIKIDELQSETHRVQAEVFKEDDVAEFNNLIELFHINIDKFETSRDLLKELLRKYDHHCVSLKSSIDSYKKTLEDYRTRMQSLELQKEQELYELSKENTKLKTNICDMEDTLGALRAENKDLAKIKEASDLASEKVVDSALKDIMNNLYQTLVTRFEDNQSFSSTEILRICGSAIKQETNNTIKKKNCNN